MINKLINKLGIGALTLALAGGLNGCRDASNDFCKTGKYNGYEVRISFDGTGRKMIIGSERDSSLVRDSYLVGKSGIYALEVIRDLKDKKKFLEIQINPEIPLEHQIIKYANLDSLEKIYNYIKENGEECK